MTLPLADSPWLLSPDDVFGFRLANARSQRFGDTREALGVEHTNDEVGAGAHSSVQVSKAVHVFKMPLFDALSGFYNWIPGDEGYPTDQPLRAYGPTVGWATAPTLRVGRASEGGAAETWYHIDAVLPGAVFGFSFTPVWDMAPNYNSTQMRAVICRRSLVPSTVGMNNIGLGGTGDPAVWLRPKALRFWLGPWDAIKELKGGTIVAHVVPPQADEE